ncbi:unnamed protein product [Brassica oleracea]
MLSLQQPCMLWLNLYVHLRVCVLVKSSHCFADPERPKNDKATILTDTVQLLKELTSEVNKLKSEYSALADESREILNLDHKLQKSTGDLYNQGQCLRGELQWSHDGSTAIFSISNAYGHASWVNANASINAILHVLGNQNPSMMPAAPCNLEQRFQERADPRKQRTLMMLQHNLSLKLLVLLLIRTHHCKGQR